MNEGLIKPLQTTLWLSTLLDLGVARVSVSTVGNFRRRHRAEGLLGLADGRRVRRKPEFGSVDDAVVEAMRKAIKNRDDDDSTPHRDLHPLVDRRGPARTGQHEYDKGLALSASTRRCRRRRTRRTR